MLTLLRTLWFRLWSCVNRRQLDAGLADELHLHRELLEEEARATGQDAASAHHTASLRLGNETHIRERTRDWWSFGWLEAVAQDTRYALCFLYRSPGFTIIAVLSLGLGIGANAAVFTVVDRLLLRPPPHVVASDALYRLNVKRIRQDGADRPFATSLMFYELFAIREQGSSFASVTPFMQPNRRRLGRGPDVPLVKESLVHGEYFEVLGVRPVMGRFFAADDDRADAPQVAAVISHGFWQRHFAGAPQAIGSRLTMSGMEAVVIGVAPAEFTGVEIDAPDVWVPLGAAGPVRIQPDWKEWTGFAVQAIVRLKPDVTAKAASAEATVILRRTPDPPRRASPTEKTVRLGSVIPGRGVAEQTAEVKVSTRLVFASGLVLLAACANLANLLLVRALARRREIALRLAVGISRRRLVGQLTIEALLIAMAGTAAALLVAKWGGGALRTMVFPQMQWATSTVNPRVMLFSLACALVVALVATVAPAIRMTRSDVARALRSAAPQLAMSTGRLRQGLLVLQVALSVLLIAGGAVFAQSLRRAYEFDLGVDLNRLVMTRLFLETDTLGGAGRRAMLEEAARRARTLPGVERATLAAAIPLVGNSVTRLTTPGLDSAMFAAYWNVTPELMETVGFRVVRGRGILPEDVRGGAQVALATETMARRLWPNENPIGKCARFGADSMPCRTIVGVIRDLREFSLRGDAAMAALLPVAEPDVSQSLGAYLVTRTSGDPKALVPQLRRLFRDVHPDLASLEIRPLAEVLDRDYRPLRLGTAMFGSFALLAVFLAAVGLYGVLAFTVTQRTGEFGIRAALGARRGRIVRQVIGEALAIVAIGLAIGGVVAWNASSAVDALLFNTEARTTIPFALAAGVLGLAALVAALVPAWRASSVHPAIALRSE